ncbi:MAG: hypothetical protein J0L73_27500 [Verrucomicrobia bacterium]|nr:hypothetical protein [Verrucomicrobiota bacterium]
MFLTSCGSGPDYYRPSFVEMARVPRKVVVLDDKGRPVLDAKGKPVEMFTDTRNDRNATLHFSDQVAINYANEMINVLQPKFNRSRYARDASATLQTTASGLVAANAATKLSSQAVSWLGITNLVLPGVQGIFDAKGRSQAYLKAAYEIKSAINEYQSYNQTPSGQVLTQNGVTLVHRTDAAIHVVESYLAGEMPDPRKVSQMVEPMSTTGATQTRAGTAAVNNISSSGLKQAVASIPLNPGRTTTDRIVQPSSAYLERVNSLLVRVDNLSDSDAIAAAKNKLGLTLNADESAKAKTLIFGVIADLRNKEDVKEVEQWEAIVPPMTATQSRIDILLEKAGTLGPRAIVIANEKWAHPAEGAPAIPGTPFTKQSKAIEAIRRALLKLQQTPNEPELQAWEQLINAQ